MPGGRLTNQDRQHIAAGLAQGHGYAEIARQLGRPTSTVSREVARNEGPDGYRADTADRATGQRARRRKPTPFPESPATPSAEGRDPAAVRDFADQFSALMVHSGLPRMAARVLVCLVTTDAGALSAAELVRDLRVSPASVSKAVGYLEGLELVRRERDLRQRRERYLIDDDTWLHTWLTSARTNAMWAEAAERGADILKTTTPAGARLKHMGQFFAQLSEDMAGGPIEAAASDELTVIAALVYSRTPLTVDQLATALGWSPDRVAGALYDVERRPDRTDPIIVQRAADTYTIAAHPSRLTDTQRKALSHQQLTVERVP